MMTLTEAAAVMRGRLAGADAKFTGVGIDSREIRPGELFVAIDGERDGHDFIAAAAEQGAVGALVSRDGGGGDGEKIPRIEVEDTTAALGALGADWRRRFSVPVVAVTGSNGKTTVTALVASILGAGTGDCLAPRASFNNQWGVPLTLLRLRARHTHAAVEMGMNRAGEIARLTKLARPTVALVNNVAPAHLGGFKDLQGVAAAKAEIFRGLIPGADGGVAVLNADDDFHDFCFAELERLGVTRIVRFSAADGDADIRAAPLPDGRIEVEIDGQTVVADWKLPGAHNIANAAAAAAAAHAAGASPAQIAEGLGVFPGALPGRLHAFIGAAGASVIDDSYNANPVSMKVALEHLAAGGGAGDGERIAVLGRMAELGEMSGELHRQIGEFARGLGVDHLLCLDEARDGDGGDIDALLAGFGGGEKFATVEQLMARLTVLLDARATVLIKGSRAADMGRVVDQLKPSPATNTVTDTVTVTKTAAETVTVTNTVTSTVTAPAQQTAGVTGMDATVTPPEAPTC